MAADPFDRARFVSAQAGVFDGAVEELRAGRKRSHWMWFVFPQLKGLGHSTTAQHYGVASLGEATAYLELRFSVRGWKRRWRLFKTVPPR